MMILATSESIFSNWWLKLGISLSHEKVLPPLNCTGHISFDLFSAKLKFLATSSEAFWYFRVYPNETFLLWRKISSVWANVMKLLISCVYFYAWIYCKTISKQYVSMFESRNWVGYKTTSTFFLMRLLWVKSFFRPNLFRCSQCLCYWIVIVDRLITLASESAFLALP